MSWQYWGQCIVLQSRDPVVLPLSLLPSREPPVVEQVTPWVCDLKLWHERITDDIVDTCMKKIPKYKLIVTWQNRDWQDGEQAPLSITSTPQNIVPALLLLTNHPHPLQLLITSCNSPVNTMEIVLRLRTLVSFYSMIVAARQLQIPSLFVHSFHP